MTLMELVRENTFQIRDDISKLEQLKQEKISDLNSTNERIKRCGSDISSNNRQLEERKTRFTAIEQRESSLLKEIDDLETRRQQLLTDLLNCRQDVDSARKILEDAKIQRSQAQRSFAEENKKIESLRRDLKDLEADYEKHKKRLGAIHIQALRKYLQNLENSIQQEFQEQANRKDSLIALQDLRKLRHEKRDIGDLCDARDELRKVLKGVMVPAVKTTIQTELDKIEIQIEKLFPGALSVEMITKDSDFIEEIYYCVDHKGRLHLFLPVSVEIWESLELGKQTVKERAAAHLFFSIARGINFEAGKVKYCCKHNFIVLISEYSDNFFLQKGDLSIGLPGGGTFSFIPSLLPDEIQESLNEEILE